MKLYLDPLFKDLKELLVEPAPGLDPIIAKTRGLGPINPAETPLFALATGGMRGRRDAVAQRPPQKQLYDNLETAIDAYIDGQKGGVNGFLTTEFEVTSGDHEAAYGWITANYAMGLLDHAASGPRTKGFLEMGGASFQVAYEAPVDHPRRHMAFEINIPVLELRRPFRVYTEEMGNLGANWARGQYISDLGAKVTRDRCWTVGNIVRVASEAQTKKKIPAAAEVRGTGLCPLDGTWAQVIQGSEVGLLTASLIPLNYLVPDPLLKTIAAGRPAIPEGTQFAGGAMFWNLSQSIYPVDTEAKHTFTRDEITDLIIKFARIPWDDHLANVRAAAKAYVNRTNVLGSGETLRAFQERKLGLFNNRVKDYSLYKSATLFSALLIYTILYRVDLARCTAQKFQPYDGVIGLDASDPTKKVGYSWTLGRAVVHAIDSEVPTLVRPITPDIRFTLCRSNADSDTYIGSGCLVVNSFWTCL